MKLPRKFRATNVAALIALSAGIALAACGSGDEPPSTSSTEDRPPTPACSARPDYGCFVPGAPEPGTDVPAASVQFALRPAVDNSFHIAGIRSGFFKDVGITITPEPDGFKATDDNAMPLALNGQNDITAMFGGSVVTTLKSQNRLKMIMFTDDFLGHWIFANPTLGLKGVNDFMAGGDDFTGALKKALAQLDGKTLTTSKLLDTRPMINTSYQLAGMQVPKLQLLEDPDSMVLARSGKVDLLAPVFGANNLALRRMGWTPIVGIADLVKNVPGGADSPVENVIFTNGVMSNRDYIAKNPNTILRFVSAVFRTIDAIKADGGKEGGLMSIAAPFINGMAGTDLSPAEVFDVLSEIDPLVPYADQGNAYFASEKDPRYYQQAYSAFIKASIDSGVLPKGPVPDDAVWAGQIFETLEWYRTQTDTILGGLPTGLSSDAAALVDKAKQYYEWHDYLDAYRFAKAAEGK